MRYGVECLIYNVFGDTSNQLLQHFPSLNNFKPEIEYGWQNKKLARTTVEIQDIGKFLEAILQDDEDCTELVIRKEKDYVYTGDHPYTIEISDGYR